MWPSFSLCACRILKIRSCLRSPLAPGSSKVLAILVSSVMFFSFNSAIVMIDPRNDSPKPGHLNVFVSALSGDFQRRVFREDKNTGQEGGAVLSSPPLCLSKILRLRQNILSLRARDPIQHPVHCFLDSGAGPVELPRGLGGELAKHITIP